MKISNMKKCPFCDSDDLVCHRDELFNKNVSYINCNNCGAQGPTTFFNNKKTAVELWDNRMAISKLSEIIKSLQDGEDMESVDYLNGIHDCYNYIVNHLEKVGK